jgi:predicted O-methyltransferase YrrM
MPLRRCSALRPGRARQPRFSSRAAAWTGDRAPHYLNERGWPAGSRIIAGNARLPPGGILARTGEAAIAIAERALAYIDEFLPEDEPLLAARRNAAEIGGAIPVRPVTGAALRFIAAAIGARSVVEIGTGCGASGIWLIRGMRAGSVLTSVDVEPEHQRLARAAFADAGFASSRYRLISGRALEVLPRLADGAYDMVFCDADSREYPEYLVAALRLLRPGGIVAFDSALGTGRVVDSLLGDPVHLDPEDDAVGEVRELVRMDENLVPLLLPIGDGLLVAVKRPG